MTSGSLRVSPEWQAMQLDGMSGVLLVVGAPDSGKTTFARYLFDRLKNLGRRVAFIDGDPGQSALGPPTTLTLTFQPDTIEGKLNDPLQTWRYFAGSITPQGHMLPVVVGAARLTQKAYEVGAQVIVYDTSGLVEPAQGGLALKNAKLDLLCPKVVFAIQQEGELEPLLLPLRRSQRAQVVELRPSVNVVRRDSHARRQHRSRQFADYFSAARLLEVEWRQVAVLPYPAFRLNRLAALEDRDGYTLGLGIVVSIDRSARRARLLTPLSTLADVSAIRLGDVLVDPETYCDERIAR